MHKNETMHRTLMDNLDKLGAFREVARSASITRASSIVHLSQSALSHLISNLEGAVGIKLFKRRPHGLELTPPGRALLEFSERLILDTESLSSRLLGFENDVMINARVGTHETLATHIWPSVLRTVTRDEKLNVSLLSGRVDGLIEMLMRGDLHATVTVEPKTEKRLRVTRLYRGRLLFFSGNELFRTKTRVQIRDIKNTPILTDSHAHVKQGLSILNALQHCNLENHGRFEVSSFEAAIRLAEMNLGIAVVPDRNAASAVREGRIRPLSIQGLSGREELEYQICLATKNSDALHEKLLKGFNKSLF